jgi:predicted Fe-Mo cluster-binding NifX family protein
MIAVIPVETNNMGACINISLGRTPFFLIYNTNTNQSLFIENTAAGSQGGAGVKAAQLMVDNGAEVVIAPACGKNAADVLLASGIKIYKSSGCSIKDNITAMIAGKLEELSDIHPGFHNHGGSGN